MGKSFGISFILLLMILSATQNLLTLQDWGIRVLTVVLIQQSIVSFKFLLLD